MASLSKQKHGKYRIYYEATGKRRILYLGRESKRNAESMKTWWTGWNPPICPGVCLILKQRGGWT